MADNPTPTNRGYPHSRLHSQTTPLRALRYPQQSPAPRKKLDLMLRTGLIDVLHSLG